MKIEKVATKDGSFTYHDSDFSETYHSTSGAKEEAEKKYAETCYIASRDEVNILDICFGLGYNSAAAIDQFKGNRLAIIALEIYPGIIGEIRQLCNEAQYPFKCADIMQAVAEKGRYSHKTLAINLIMGDARDTIKPLKSNSFDVVFLDPFSPKRCPELWTEEFFRDIYRVMRKNGVLATYSCAGVVRRNLKAAGFVVEDGPRVGRRSPSTVARKCCPDNKNT
jgi:tRNA U34 5-methylaminomethyl-2-thiouridine-forming methyltransferase MnmC